MGKVEKRVLNSIWRYSSIRLFALLGKAHPKWWYETDLVQFDPNGFFSFRPDGESRKTRFELNLTIFVNSAFCAAWKSPPKMVVWNRPRAIWSQRFFFVSPRWGKSKNAFWTQFDDIRKFGFLRCLEKPTQNGGMKPTSCNLIPTVFFRFAPMGKVEKRVLNSIWRYSSIRLFALLGKAHPKWWYETDLVQFDPNGFFSFRPDGESRKTRFELNFDDIRQFGFLRCLEKPTQNSGMKPTSWISIPRVFFRFAPMGNVEKCVLNSIWRYSSIRLFALLGKAHPKWWYETDLLGFDPNGVFSSRPDGECVKTRFELILTIFENSAFCAAWKSPPKIVVWNRPRGFWSQGCFFVSPRCGMSKNAFWTQFDDIRQFGFLRCLEKPTQNGGMKPTSCNLIPTVFFRFAPMGKVEKRVLNSIWRYSSIRLFALLGKAHPKWWYETDLVQFDPNGFFSFRPDGESRKTRFELNLTIFVNSAFCPAWKSPPKMVVWNRPRAIWSQRCFFVSPRWGKSKNAFWTQFDDNRHSASCAAWKSQPKMVVWNRPRAIWSQRCFFVSPRWGKSKNAFWTQFDDIRQLRFLRCLEKPTQNGGMKPTSCNLIPTVFFRFAPMGKVEKRVLNSIWRYSSIRLFALLGKAHPKWWYETDLVQFDPNGVFSFRPYGESRKTRFELNLTIIVNSAFCAAWKCPPKIVVWNRPRAIWSQRFFFVSPRWGKSKNAFWTQFDDIRQFGFLPCLEKPTQNGGMKPTSCNLIPTVFFRFAPMGKVEKRVLNSIWR